MNLEQYRNLTVNEITEKLYDETDQTKLILARKIGIEYELVVTGEYLQRLKLECLQCLELATAIFNYLEPNKNWKRMEQEKKDAQSSLNAEKAKVKELEEEKETLKQKIIANIQKLQLHIDLACNEELIQSYSMQIRELRNLLKMI